MSAVYYVGSCDYTQVEKSLASETINNYCFLFTETEYNVQILGIFADFSLGAKVYQDVEDTLKDLEIGILGKPHCHLL